MTSFPDIVHQPEGVTISKIRQKGKSQPSRNDWLFFFDCHRSTAFWQHVGNQGNLFNRLGGIGIYPDHGILFPELACGVEDYFQFSCRSGRNGLLGPVWRRTAAGDGYVLDQKRGIASVFEHERMLYLVALGDVAKISGFFLKLNHRACALCHERLTRKRQANQQK